MPLTAHFLAVTPDGCPEEIEAGPFTEERAKDALFAWEMNGGCPARVVCLAEVSDLHIVVVDGDSIEDIEHDYRNIGTREEALRVAATWGDRGIAYGLVPAKG